MGAPQAALLGASIAMDIIATEQQKQVISTQARTESKIAEIQAAEDAIAIQNQLFQTLSQNIAATEAQGLAMTGTPQRMQETSIRRAGQAVAQTRKQARLDKAMLRHRAKMQRRMADVGLFARTATRTAGVALRTDPGVDPTQKTLPEATLDFERPKFGRTFYGR
jgi:hypothetical protein